MAEKKEQKSFLGTVLNWAKWGAIGFLGIDALLILGAPLAIVNTAINFALNGALYGGLAGGMFAGLREIGKALSPKQSTKT